MRFWLSGPRILHGLVRPGISIGPEDVRPRLPRWRRYEYRKALKAYAAKRGQHITNEEADYRIDKAHAMGELDAGGPTLHIKGSRDEIIAGILDGAEQFGLPMDRTKAEKIADKAINGDKLPLWAAIVLGVIAFVIIGLIIIGNTVAPPA
ncbi:hypothetical protein RZS28_00585 [Methylocapsa polymorpha]|uniref:Uncharacterized protein n=1 Tax=Methylocapsa polymorpha TaxID=3080828 RepID=A0ABZ0HSH9_9HYPH|nr:hypothetical protein RZS28_00585 [Methylocapsa sp. RX1]